MRKATVVLAAIGLALALVSAAQAEIIATKASEDFGTYQYEMSVTPFTQDLDSVGGNPPYDWSTTGTPSISGGILILDMAIAEQIASLATDEAWDVMAPTKATGFTIEFSMKVPSTTYAYAIRVMAGSAGSNTRAYLEIGDDVVAWNVDALAVPEATLDSNDNADDFHVFRLAQEANTELFSVWRDGELLSNTPIGGISSSVTDKLVIYNPGKYWSGDVEIDYIRFTKGAYAPVPEPSALVLLATGLMGLIAYAWRKRR